MLSYNQLLEKLYALSRGKSTLDLVNMQRLNLMMGSPAHHLRAIHIAGTNGKGSVTTKIAHALTLSGYRVGCYTSPHISSFRERISINGCPISKEALCAHLSDLMQAADEQHIPYSFFEITTALMFLFFVKQQVDVAVIETGLGGRLDATNIVHPSLSIITSISYDHTAQLGSTLQAIAQEKGGIIKPNVPVVLGPHANFPVLHELAANLHAQVAVVPFIDGDYDTENRAIAEVALVLTSDQWPISEAARLEGLQKRPPCRMEEVSPAVLANGILAACSSHPHRIILDVGHNPDGIARLLDALNRHFPKAPIYLLCAFSEDKEIAPMLRALLDRALGATVSAANHARALPWQQLLTLAQSLCPEKAIEGRASIEEALLFAAHEAARRRAILVICGTFFMMGQVRHALGFREELDFTPLYEIGYKKT